jgi:DNA-binding response OmpR family regulator
VDDDAQLRKLAVRILRSWGLTVIAEAGTCAAALSQSAKLRPDAALVDISLPDGDGFALARQLSSEAWRPRIVLISSDSDPANGVAARAMGADFVPKDELLGPDLRRLITGE